MKSNYTLDLLFDSDQNHIMLFVENTNATTISHIQIFIDNYQQFLATNKNNRKYTSVANYRKINWI